MASNSTTPADLVFKVKYGDNLKRITKSANGEPLSTNLGLLKSKIRECFAISNGQDFNLTYIDKEGDTVMLADNSDLHDATVTQALNPVRINVVEPIIRNDGKSKSGKKHNRARRSEIKSFKRARAEPELSHGQTIVQEGIKGYRCGKFTPMGDGNSSNTCAKCAPKGTRTGARSSSWMLE